MRFSWLFIASALLFIASCTRQELDGFDSTIEYAQDFKIDPVTGDTVYSLCMPKAFTPDGDGLNDIYHVWGTGIDSNSFEMRMYSREGNMLFYSDDPARGFDGRIQGRGEINADQVLSVTIDLADTLGEEHYYSYDILQFR